MNSLFIAEINMTLVVFLQIILPIGFAFWVRKQNHRFQSNAIKVMLVLGLGSTLGVVVAELGADTVKSLTVCDRYCR